MPITVPYTKRYFRLLNYQQANAIDGYALKTLSVGFSKMFKQFQTNYNFMTSAEDLVIRTSKMVSYN